MSETELSFAEPPSPAAESIQEATLDLTDNTPTLHTNEDDPGDEQSLSEPADLSPEDPQSNTQAELSSSSTHVPQQGMGEASEAVQGVDELDEKTGAKIEIAPELESGDEEKRKPVLLDSAQTPGNVNLHIGEEFKSSSMPVESDDITPSQTTECRPVQSASVDEPQSSSEAQNQESKTEKVVSASNSIPPKIRMTLVPGSQGLPSSSSMCIKLETWLRLHKIPYDLCFNKDFAVEDQPAIVIEDVKYRDTNLAISKLRSKFDIASGKGDALNKALERAFVGMLEGSTLWAVRYSRWATEGGEKKTTNGGIKLTSMLNKKFQQRKIKSTLHHQGIGKQDVDTVISICHQDLSALSTFLGDKPFFEGSSPGLLDCTAFGILACLVYSGEDSPIRNLIQSELVNLVDFCQRMKELCWQDWDSRTVTLSTTQTNLMKRFSFRQRDKSKDSRSFDKDQQHEKPAKSTQSQQDPASVDASNQEKNIPEDGPEGTSENFGRPV